MVRYARHRSLPFTDHVLLAGLIVALIMNSKAQAINVVVRVLCLDAYVQPCLILLLPL
jgi:hypothetical protein